MQDLTPAPAPAAELTATLLVGSLASRCSNCRMGTLISGVTHHRDVSGYSPQPGAGCGARFTAIAAEGWAATDAELRALRPDLPVRA
ncbi:hypothetical protein QMK19_03400 [Streptomyces sp. H10-C2]|uniref:hypothetical protein n=1 Tax=unclassified Streptomyces TaxID=2593676 RepID=UPI0024BA5300|nr:MULTISPECIES: hypothetical protein [unclassified Streptomyces]MDJ0342232.1 hypothetical protein [Streptomyces sp. PH10-H1]MDJ0368746.1 hypothetical protein [Streptomyces sp. H10-C2]